MEDTNIEIILYKSSQTNIIFCNTFVLCVSIWRESA
jgi:hypothetical protein